MKNFNKIIFLLVIILINSCTKNKDKENSSIIEKKIEDSIIIQKTVEKPTKNKDLDFLTTEGLVSDIVPKEYEIQHEAKGDLNNDGLPDQVLILRKKSDTLAQRTALVL